MGSRVQPSVRMFNAYARELVLIAKKHCSSEHKASLKKRFKLFDASSPKYVREFLDRRCDGSDTESKQVFAGITENVISNAVPSDMSEIVGSLLAGMTLAASLLDDETSEEVVSKVASAIISQNPASVEDTIMDEDLVRVLEQASNPRLSDRLVDDLRVIAASSIGLGREGSQPPGRSALGIVGLAEEISRELDISSLMTSAGAHGGGGEAGLATIIDSINRKVQGRIQDGSVDAARLCSEAQAILGSLPPGASHPFPTPP
jgi:hypothetical protein